MENTSLPVARTMVDWLKPYGVSPRDLFKGLSLALSSQSITEWQTAYEVALDNCAIEKAGDRPADLSFVLILRSLLQTIYLWLLEIEHLPIRYSLQEEEEIARGLDLSYENELLEIGREFFLDPASHSLLPHIKKSLEQWLKAHAMEGAQARACLNRIDSYFVHALDLEWHRHREYEVIGRAIDCLFTGGDSVDRFWMSYGFYWDKKVHQPIFGVEPFDMTQVYQPLRAWRQVLRNDGCLSRFEWDGLESSPKDGLKQVVDIEQELIDWIEKGRDDDRVRMVGGAPGSGLASFDHMFAHRVIRSGKARVLLVPLSMFQSGPDMEQGLVEYFDAVSPSNQNPFEDRGDPLPLLLVFSHLERVKHQEQGRIKAGIDFARSISAFMKKTGHQDRRVLVLLTSWPVIFNALEKELPKAVVNYTLLPFYLPPESRSVYADPRGLLETDQRKQFWTMYRRAMGDETWNLPPEKEDEIVQNLPALPLLTYMAASSISRRNGMRAGTAGFGAVVEDYINSAYDRTFDDRRPYRWSHYLDRNQFHRVLEEAAVTVWRAKSRAITVKDLETHFKETGLSNYYSPFIEQARSGVLGVISIGHQAHHIMSADDNEMVDFLHMSFQYILAGRRIVRELNSLHQGVLDREKDEYRGISHGEALGRWVALCGPVWIDHGVFPFMSGQFQSENIQDLEAMQDTIRQLLDHAINEGMPLNRLPRNLNFREQAFWSRNAEETLLAAHYICAQATERLSGISWPDPMAAGDWIRRVQYQRIGKHGRLMFECLAYLDFKDCLLDGIDLWGANLRGSDLSRASLQSACLVDANLAKSHIFSADFKECNLKRAGLEWINARQTRFVEADLRKANMKEGDFSGADFSRADLRGADLTGANLSGAGFCGANLGGAVLRWADMRDAHFKDALLDRTDLREAVLNGPELDDAVIPNRTL